MVNDGVFFSLSEINLVGLVASQSSVIHPSEANFAIDGNSNPNFDLEGSCIITQAGQ